MKPTDSFDALWQEGRARSARMLDESKPLPDNLRADIVARADEFLQAHGLTLKHVAAEARIPYHGLYDAVHLRNIGPKSDRRLIQLHNFMERYTRRDTSVRERGSFVLHSVARDIITVAQVVAETGKVGVVWGPPDTGKTMTLQAIEGDARFGSPVLITLDPSTVRPLPLLRAIADRFGVSKAGPMPRLFDRLAQRLEGTARLLCFDNADSAEARTLDTIRALHDRTGCPVLLCGVPFKFGLRRVGDGGAIGDVCLPRSRGSHPVLHADQVRPAGPDADRAARATGAGRGGGHRGAMVLSGSGHPATEARRRPAQAGGRLRGSGRGALRSSGVLNVAKLNSDPGSSTSKQRQTLHVLAERMGWSKDELHEALGVKSVRELSSADASEWIAKLGGELPYEPGTKPAPFAGRRQRTGAIRMIHPDHVDQIKRLGVEHFGDVDSLLTWLHKDFKTEHSLARKPEDIDRMIRSLGTAKRAGQVIRVLKEMIARRASGAAEGCST